MEDRIVIRRLVALSVLGSAAALGYVGARRLGRWLDGPMLEVPDQSRPSADVPREFRHEFRLETRSPGGWQRWSEKDRTTV
jgi:hypothetical protein